MATRRREQPPPPRREEVREAVVEVVRLAAAWERSLDRGEQPPAFGQDQRFLAALVKQLHAHHENANVVRLDDGSPRFVLADLERTRLASRIRAILAGFQASPSNPRRRSTDGKLSKADEQAILRAFIVEKVADISVVATMRRLAEELGSEEEVRKTITDDLASVSLPPEVGPTTRSDGSDLADWIRGGAHAGHKGGPSAAAAALVERFRGGSASNFSKIAGRAERQPQGTLSLQGLSRGGVVGVGDVVCYLLRGMLDQGKPPTSWETLSGSAELRALREVIEPTMPPDDVDAWIQAKREEAPTAPEAKKHRGPRR